MLSIKKPAKLSAQNCSPVQHTSTVVLSIFNPNYNAQVKVPNMLGPGGLVIVTSEPITWGIETSWKDGAAASVAGKINELMTNKFVRMMSGPELFTPVATDSWSQQVVEKGSPISIKLKFRAYYHPEGTPGTEYATCSESYVKVFRLLTYMTAPPKEYSLSTATIGVVANVASNLVNTGEKIGKAVDNRPEDTNFFEATAKYTLAAVAEAGGLNMPSDGSAAQRGQYTFKLKTNDFGCDQLDWIVKGFTMTPSTQFAASKEDRSENIKIKAPMPLWVDFEVDLETNMAPSNALVSRFFKKKNVVVNN